MTISKIKVVFLVENLYYGGGEKVSRELLSIDNEHITTHLITINSPQKAIEEDLLDKVSTLGIKCPSKKGIFYYILRVRDLLNGILQYRKYLINNHISYSIDVGAITAIFNQLSCFGTHTKPISTKHTIYNLSPATSKNWGQLTSKIYVKMYLLSLKHMEKVIAVSDGVVSSLISSGIPSEKIVKIYNPIDIEQIQKLSLEKNQDEPYNNSLPVILNVGRLEPIKGQWHLIRVFREVRKVIPCKLVICGDGSLQSFLRKLVDEYNLSEDVFFSGYVDNPYKYYRNSTISVMASISEALPYAVLESMACSCPVLASRNPGTEEICGNDKYGILSSPLIDNHDCIQFELDKSENELKEKLIHLLNNPILCERYTKLGLEKVQEFNKENAYDKYRRLIMSL